jgi:N-acetylneuraminic acid mutarotase
MKKLLLITATVFFIQIGNAQTITWKKLASIPKPCADGEAVVLNNNVYLVAGNHDQYIASSDFYCPGKWDSLLWLKWPGKYLL